MAESEPARNRATTIAADMTDWSAAGEVKFSHALFFDDRPLRWWEALAVHWGLRRDPRVLGAWAAGPTTCQTPPRGS